MPRETNRPRALSATDINQWAAMIVERTTGVKVPDDLVEQEIRKIAEEKAAAGQSSPSSSSSDDGPAKNPAAVLLGRRGGLKGGAARAAVLSATERKKIAKKASEARWERVEKIKKLNSKGYSVQEIADKLGVSPAVVERHRDRLAKALESARERRNKVNA